MKKVQWTFDSGAENKYRVKKSIGLSQDATGILRLEFIEVALCALSLAGSQNLSNRGQVSPLAHGQDATSHALAGSQYLIRNSRPKVQASNLKGADFGCRGQNPKGFCPRLL